MFYVCGRGEHTALNASFLLRITFLQISKSLHGISPSCITQIGCLWRIFFSVFFLYFHIFFEISSTGSFITQPFSVDE